jgi:uncharacterized protein YraI/predicted small lipoprotein YifL
MRTSRRAGGLSLVLASLAACGDQGPIIETVDTDVPVVDAPTVTDRPRAADVQRITDVPVVAPPRDAGAPAVDVPRAVMDSGVVVVEEPTPDLTPDGGAPVVDVEPATPTTGATMRVTATSLNLRSGVGTSNAILTVLSCGARVTVLGGPTTGWWNIRSGAFTGWASGAYLVAEAGFDPAVCGGTTPPAMDAGTPTTTPPGVAPEVSQMFSLARSAVGYSYYWGHGSWGTDGRDHGSCSGSCPSCSHTGRYGADCSGFVAKVWQIPSASPVTTDRHPYSTYNFVNSTTHWSRVARTAVRPGDALTYNTNGAGHIVLFESGSDPWGSVWTYEARGCATGIVHNLRTVGSNYVGIRREGL